MWLLLCGILERENFGMKNEIWQLEVHFLFKPGVLVHRPWAGTPV